MQLHTEDPGKSGSIRALFLACAVMLGAALGVALLTHEEETTARQPRTQLTAAQHRELQPAPAPPPRHAAPAPRFDRDPPSPGDFALDREPEDGNGS